MKRVREKMRDVERRMETVSKHLPDHYEEFAELDIKRDGIYKNVEIAIQSCYDIAVMIVKEERLAVPEDEASIPLLLAEAGIISTEQAETLQDMKGFRNVLAHRYGRIDDEAAFNTIQDGLDDFEGYLTEVREYLDTREEDQE